MTKPKYIELTPHQADLLLQAWTSERNRKRHEIEEWHGQTARDKNRRDLFARQAIADGVPIDQVNKFIFDT